MHLQVLRQPEVLPAAAKPRWAVGVGGWGVLLLFGRCSLFRVLFEWGLGGFFLCCGEGLVVMRGWC